MNGIPLRCEAISKSFPGVKALDSVNLEVHDSSVHGIVGENGAGKSTLLKILSGFHTPTSGRIVIRGEDVQLINPKAAFDRGIAVIYQELNLVPEMTVAENLFLGRYPRGALGIVDHGGLYRSAREQLDFLRLKGIDPRKKVKRFPIAQRQMIEIAKALLHRASILAFDEPTSSLSEREKNRLFQIIRNLRREGKAVIYVSHRLEEIFELCDVVTVLRDGRRAAGFHDMAAVDRDTLVTSMVGREIGDVYGYRPRSIGGDRLRVDALRGGGTAEAAAFSVKRGEILGFFGLVGAGRTELMRLIYGADKPESGAVYLEGTRVVISNPQDAIRNGICYCPEDRKDQGIFAVHSVSDNINISCRRGFSAMGLLLDLERERENSERFIKRLGIRTPSGEQRIGKLSGGNQQKVILARWLSENLKVLLMDEPTRGIDVGAKYEIYQLMYELAESGTSVIVVSSDLPEVMGIADRIIVMRAGCIVGEIPRSEASEERILGMALPPESRPESSPESENTTA